MLAKGWPARRSRCLTGIGFSVCCRSRLLSRRVQSRLSPPNPRLRRLSPVVQVSCQPIRPGSSTSRRCPNAARRDEDSDPVATLRQFTYLAVRGYQGEWAEVLNPRTHDRRLRAERRHRPDRSAAGLHHRATRRPPSTRSIVDGRAIRGAALSFYPTPDPDAQTETLATTRRSPSPTASRATTARPGIAPPTATICPVPTCACRARRRARSPAAGSTSICASRPCWSPTTAISPCSPR